MSLVSGIQLGTLAADFASRRIYFVVAAIVIVLDQATKLLADNFVRGRGAIEVIPGFFNLWYSRNRGGLFGSFAEMGDPWRTILLTGFPIVMIVAIGLFILKTADADRRSAAGLASVLGGAIGNLLDRVVRGSVVDFLDVYASHEKLASWLTAHFGTAHWPTFNIADAAIVTGACLLALDVLRPQPARATPLPGA